MKKFLYGTTAVLLLLFAILLPWASSAQTDTVLQSNHPIYDELSGTVVNCMLQDSQGFLWFGTQIGLYRYDGYSLKPYSLDSEFSNRFSSNFITSILEDNSGNIWIGTFGAGLFKLNPSKGNYLNFNNNIQNSNRISDNTIRALCKDNFGKIWIGTQNRGLDCLDPVSGNFVHHENIPDNPNSLSSNTITSICRDKAGTLWVGTIGGGLNKLDPQSGKFLHYTKQANTSGSLSDNNISTLYVDRTNILWIVAQDGKLSKFDPVSGKLLTNDFQELKDMKLNKVCEDISGNLWIGTYGNGVKMLDRASGKLTSYGSNLHPNTSSSNYRVMSLYADTSGNLWIGTEGRGLDKINTNLNFISYMGNIGSGMSFSDDVVLSIYKDKSGIIWIGTANGGVNRFDRKNGKITYYKNNPSNSSSISSNTVNSIFEDSHGTLWFGTIDGILNKFEPSSQNFVRYRINSVKKDIRDNGILKIYEGSDGMLWICAANGGLVRFDSSTGQYVQFTNNPSNPDSISSDHVLSLAEDNSKTFWIGTAGGGLNKLDIASNKFIRYSISQADSVAQTFNYSVNSIVSDGDILWLATDKGIFKFDKTREKFTFLEDSHQIVNSLISGLLKDSRNNLWLGTANGLIKYTIKSGDFKKYDFEGGLQRNQYTQGAYFKSDDDEMFFGGTNGFSCFYADKIKDNTHKPPVIITGFKIFNTPADISNLDIISLTHKDDFFSFEFAALDYANPSKNQYAYKLDGFDDDWHYSGTRNYAGYTNLDGGEYILRIKASNNDGVWNEQGTQIKLSIIPPLWQTTEFIIAAVFLVLAVIFLIIKLRIRSIKLKNMALERLVIDRTKELNLANEQLRNADELKSNFLSTVSHEIRTPLSAILGFTEVIAGKIEKTILPNIDLKDTKVKNATEKIRRDLNIIISEGDRLSTLVSNLLNITKIESGRMDWKTEILSISEIIEQALSIAKPIIERAGLTASVDIEENLPALSGDRDMLTQVLINLISNSVKFTREGSINICAKHSKGQILVSVEDTGIGMAEENLDKIFERFYKADASYTRNSINNNVGLGLYICKQITEKHGGKIWAESQPGKGSTLYFSIPHL